MTGVVSSVAGPGFMLSVQTRSRHEHRWGRREQPVWGVRTRLATPTTVTVAVSATTRYSQPGIKSPRVVAGEAVRVEGTLASDGTLDATHVQIPSISLVGTVSVPGTSSLTLTGTSTTLEGLQGFVQLTATASVVDLSAATRFHEPGVASPGPGALVTGDVVRVSGSQAGSDASGALVVEASQVLLPEVVTVGTVGTIGSSSFTMSPRHPGFLPGWGMRSAGNAGGPPARDGRQRGAPSMGNELTVDVTSTTKFSGTGGTGTAATALGSLAHGDRVKVRGVQAGTSTVDALGVVALGSRR